MFDIHTTALEDRARPEARKMTLGERLSGVAFRVLGLLRPACPGPDDAARARPLWSSAATLCLRMTT